MSECSGNAAKESQLILNINMTINMSAGFILMKVRAAGQIAKHPLKGRHLKPTQGFVSQQCICEAPGSERVSAQKLPKTLLSGFALVLDFDILFALSAFAGEIIGAKEDFEKVLVMRNSEKSCKDKTRLALSEILQCEAEQDNQAQEQG